VIRADELGPVVPRTFPPAPGWSPEGHRINPALEYSRGSDKTWVCGGLRIREGHELSCCAPSRNGEGWMGLLTRIARAHPRGPIRVVSDNPSGHTGGKVRRWLARHRRIRQVFIPKGACWLNLAEGWWRLLRRAAFAGQTFVDTDEIIHAVEVATTRLNARAKPWVWGRPPPPTRKLRRKFVYLL
jgi:transposase